MQCTTACFIAVLTTLIVTNEAIVRRCWTCRSRGEFGDCRDPFPVNLTSIDKFPGVDAAPCASGWCAKLIEGDDIEFSVATERMCIQNPPDDGEERCAETQWKHRKVYMCFCQGDLCNSAPRNVATSTIFALFAVVMRNLLAYF